MTVRCRRGFTLVELLVVIAIIGVLVALLLPAVQAARESARRTQCQNHLKQIALAFQNHHDSFNHLPTGGWGWSYVGDPDGGFGVDQPGGWLYNILPFIEQKSLHDIGLGQVGPLKQTELAQLVGTPVKFYYCPSRRPPQLYPIDLSHQPLNAAQVLMGAKSDYAANCGDQWDDENTPGSPTIAVPTNFTGIIFNKSRVRLGEILDGLSNTVMVGEKHLCPLNYYNGLDGADNENLYCGFDNDNARSMNDLTTGANTSDIRFPPRRDTKSLPNLQVFGSAHSAGFNVCLCDGSVRMIAYTIESTTYKKLGNRNDGQPIEGF